MRSIRSCIMHVQLIWTTVYCIWRIELSIFWSDWAIYMCRFIQLKTIQKTSTSLANTQHMVSGAASSFETPPSWRSLHLFTATGFGGALHEGCLCRTCLPLRCESEVCFSTSITTNLSKSFSSFWCCIKQVYCFGRTYFAFWWNRCKRLSLLSLETPGTIRITWLLRLITLRT